MLFLVIPAVSSENMEPFRWYNNFLWISIFYVFIKPNFHENKFSLIILSITISYNVSLLSYENLKNLRIHFNFLWILSKFVKIVNG